MNTKTSPAVVTGTLYHVCYLVMIYFFPSSSAPYIIFAFSPVVVIWMALYILKHGKPSTRTFDDYFYDSGEWKRN